MRVTTSSSGSIVVIIQFSITHVCLAFKTVEKSHVNARESLWLWPE